MQQKINKKQTKSKQLYARNKRKQKNNKNNNKNE